MKNKRLSFQSSFLFVFVYSLVIASIVAVGLVWYNGGKWNATAFLYGLAIGTVFLFFWTFLFISIYPVYLSEEGIRCYNSWGVYRTFDWSEISFVKSINILGFRYLRIGSVEGGSKLWVPMFLEDMAGFREAVRDFAGTEHVLTKALGGDRNEDLSR